MKQIGLHLRDGGGQMGALIRAKDWSRAAIGPTAAWPQSLRTALGICLASPSPMLVWWGPELTILYNDAYIPIFGSKHPWALGRGGRDAWGEVWHVIEPMLNRVIAYGEASWSEDMLLGAQRFGFAEEAYFTWSCTPIVDETGGAGGALTTVAETTLRVIGARRLETLRALGEKLADSREIDVACKLALEAIGDNRHDFMFGALYLVDEDGRTARLAARTANLTSHAAFPSSLPVEHEVWPIAAVLRSGAPQLAGDLSTRIDPFPPGVWPEVPHSASILPIADAGHCPLGVLIAGISPRLAFDDAYREFYARTAGHIAAAIAAATSHAEEHHRADMLAELDRARISWFSNLSQELPSVPGGSGEPIPPPAASPLGDIADARLLVVDDHADMRDYLRRVLGKRWRVAVAPDGERALEAARTARPDLIVTDVTMPNLDGFGLLRALRADPELATVPVVLLSARSGEDDRIEGIDAGADAYLIKPFSARELIARVSNLLQLSRLRREVELERNRLAMFVQQTPVGVAFLEGPEFRCRLYNAAYARMLRRPIRLGTPILELLPEIRGTESMRRFEAVFHQGVSLDGSETRFVFKDADGTERECYFDTSFRPLRDAAGAVSGVAAISVDITDQLLARRAVEQSRSEAIAANRAKDEFLAMLGHELRNPLAPILTALELMRLRGGDVLMRERAIIERQTHHLAAMLEDLLDVSRITRGVIQLKRERRPLADVIDKAIETAAPVFEQQRHELVVQVPHDIAVDADVARMTQVFANLLTNAAKYTDPGGRVTVAATTRGGEAIVMVTDTGRGITPDMLPHVFDLFVQERQNLDRSRGGLGLGLAIVRSLVRLHGGRVEVSSPGPGHGATFTVWLPRVPDVREVRDVRDVCDASSTDAPDAPSAIARPERRATSVLVVDDNVDAATLLADLLESHGYTARVAHDAPQVLELAHDFVPDVALLDIGLPAMDGYELAHRLRALPSWCNVRMMALTGYGQSSDHIRSKEAGFDHYLVKPISFATLESLLPAVAR
jgi:signal transduction histidine kinase